MTAHLEDRAAALMARGWTRREAEWLALVCLHSGVFLRSQYLAFVGRTNPALAHRFIRRCRRYAVKQPWNGSRLRVYRIAARRLSRVLGVEHVRHRRPAAPEVVLRRLLALDYLLERPRTSWLPTEAEKVDALTAAGIARDVLPRRLYQGAVGGQYRYFPHNLPVALDGWRATFVFAQDEDETESAVRTWGSQHGALWAALIASGRAVEVIAVGHDPERLEAAERVLDKWASTPPESVTMAHEGAAAEMAAIKTAIATGDSAALEAYGGLNPALRRTRILNVACGGSRRSPAAITVGRTWRSTRVPSDLLPAVTPARPPEITPEVPRQRCKWVGAPTYVRNHTARHTRAAHKPPVLNAIQRPQGPSGLEARESRGSRHRSAEQVAGHGGPDHRGPRDRCARPPFLRLLGCCLVRADALDLVLDPWTIAFDIGRSPGSCRVSWSFTSGRP